MNETFHQCPMCGRRVLDYSLCPFCEDDEAYFDRLAMWEENEAANQLAEEQRPGWGDR